MALYELLVLLKPSVSDDEAAGITEKIQSVVARHGAQVTQTVNWGKKKLTYEIQKEKKAVYLVFRFEASGTAAGEIVRACRLEDAVLRTLVVRVEAGTEMFVETRPPAAMDARD
jgi:small subunit ribosomal protein S6